MSLSWNATRWESSDGTFQIVDHGPGGGLERYAIYDRASLLYSDSARFPTLEAAQAAAIPEGHKAAPCPVCNGMRICRCEYGGEG